MNNRHRIFIIGAGFAGIWSALSAMRYCVLYNKVDEFEIIVLNKNAYHGLRPRYYEHDLASTQIHLDKILTPFKIKYIVGEVIDIDVGRQTLVIKNNLDLSTNTYAYDRLILAAGSILQMPPIQGLDAYAFNIDTYEAACCLKTHLQTLHQSAEKKCHTITIVGGGFTGIEVAAELISTLKKLGINKKNYQIILLDRAEVGAKLGSEVKQAVLNALNDLGVKIKNNAHLSHITKEGVYFNNGDSINTQTVIWTGGIRAHPIAELFSTERDSFGRLKVDAFLRIQGVPHCYAAGDVACAMPDENRLSNLSCQHAIPQGRYAGHNAVAEILGAPLLKYEQKTWVTLIDLGGWGAIYAEGWEPRIAMDKQAAKKMKQYVNQHRIKPIQNGTLSELVDLAEPTFKPMSG